MDAGASSIRQEGTREPGVLRILHLEEGEKALSLRSSVLRRVPQSWPAYSGHRGRPYQTDQPGRSTARRVELPVAVFGMP